MARLKIIRGDVKKGKLDVNFVISKPKKRNFLNMWKKNIKARFFSFFIRDWLKRKKLKKNSRIRKSSIE
jgi:hypothetical protein